MMSAGYSGTPLAKKLDIRPGMTVQILGGPNDYERTLGPLPDDVRITRRLGRHIVFAQQFATQRVMLERRLPLLAERLEDDGMIWVSWPKKASGVDSDLDGNIVRNLGLDTGLVDVKVCAVDDTWSGLKFVRRVRDRARPS